MDGSNVGRLGVLSEFEVSHYGAGRHGGSGQVVDAETFQVVYLEMFQQFSAGGGFRERPVVELEHEIARAEVLLELAASAAFVQNFLGGEVGQQLVDVFRCTFADEKLTGGYVEKGDAAGAAAEVDGSEKVVFLAVEDVVGERYAGSDEFRDAALHQFLGEFGVFELVADGHAVSGADELGQIGVQGVMGKSRHLRGGSRTLVVAPREGDAQDLRSRHGVLAVGFVEVAAAEEQNGVRVLRLQVVKLFHHGGQ